MCGGSWASGWVELHVWRQLGIWVGGAARVEAAGHLGGGAACVEAAGHMCGWDCMCGGSWVVRLHVWRHLGIG